MTEAQERTLRQLCENYGVEFDADHYRPAFELPDGWVAGWIGGNNHGLRYVDAVDDWVRVTSTTIYVGVSPEGEASS